MKHIFLFTLTLFINISLVNAAESVISISNQPQLATPVSNEKNIITVFAVTGKQGSATAKELLKRGYQVVGTSRNPESKSSIAIKQELGIEIRKADFLVQDSLNSAMQGSFGVFFYTPHSLNQGEMAKNVVTAAKINSIKHIVYTTASSADPINGFPDDTPKKQAEAAIRNSGLSYSFLRPVGFMDNWLRMKATVKEKGINSVMPEWMTQFIAVSDIAWFVGESFDNQHEWKGRELNIAGEQMSFEELARTFSKVIGTEITYAAMPWEKAKQYLPPHLVEIFEWVKENGQSVNVKKLRKEYPNLTTVEQFLRQQGFDRI